MSDFSIQDAAFTGFRVVREHARALPAWIALSVVFNLAIQIILVGMAGPALSQMTVVFADMAAHPAAFDPSVFSRAMPALLPAYGVILPLSIVFNAVLYAAMNRVVLRPQDNALGYLRFGADELRQFGLQFLLALLFFGLYFIGVFTIVFVMILAQGLGPLLAVLGVVAGLCGFTFLGVRLSLASASTFQGAKIDLATSWTLTKGRFWPLFGTYVLAFVLAIVIVILATVVIGVISAILGIAGLGAAPTANVGDIFTLASLLSPVRLIAVVLNAAAGALMWPVLLTPSAAVYRQLSRRHGPGAAEAFS